MTYQTPVVVASYSTSKLLGSAIGWSSGNTNGGGGGGGCGLLGHLLGQC